MRATVPRDSRRQIRGYAELLHETAAERRRSSNRLITISESLWFMPAGPNATPNELPTLAIWRGHRSVAGLVVAGTVSLVSPPVPSQEGLAHEQAPAEDASAVVKVRDFLYALPFDFPFWEDSAVTVHDHEVSLTANDKPALQVLCLRESREAFDRGEHIPNPADYRQLVGVMAIGAAGVGRIAPAELAIYRQMGYGG